MTDAKSGSRDHERCRKTENNNLSSRVRPGNGVRRARAQWRTWTGRVEQEGIFNGLRPGDVLITTSSDLLQIGCKNHKFMMPLRGTWIYWTKGVFSVAVLRCTPRFLALRPQFGIMQQKNFTGNNRLSLCCVDQKAWESEICLHCYWWCMIKIIFIFESLVN